MSISLYQGPADCDFEGGDFCLWSNNQTDHFDWTIGQGKTGSSFTGPSFDHTKQVSPITIVMMFCSCFCCYCFFFLLLSYSQFSVMLCTWATTSYPCFPHSFPPSYCRGRMLQGVTPTLQCVCGDKLTHSFSCLYQNAAGRYTYTSVRGQ